MFPCRYGRRNVVNRCSVVNRSNRGPVLGVGLLVQILGSGRGPGWGTVGCLFGGCFVGGVGDKPSAY